MTTPFQILGNPDADILIVADHASNHVPPDIDLGIDPACLDDHIALDIGVAEIARELVETGEFCAILAGVSRLVIDLNREPESPGLVPVESDGIAIPGNRGADVGARLRRFYDPYHAMVERLAHAAHEPFILSLHSFTPSLASRPEEARPWHIGVLYNEDERAAPIAIAALERLGHRVGDQQPYSGKLLNATMNRHAEAHGRHYLGVEIRQDLIMERQGQRRFAHDLRLVAAEVRKSLHQRGGW
ncbi:MAG TPA: N-formylglutamate amidohydrolase [Sphingobium sp.]|nr:N-formylglutamate amidohydrolase [Sphingobium sp.]